MAVSTFQLYLNIFELLPVEPSSIAEKGQLTKATVEQKEQAVLRAACTTTRIIVRDCIDVFCAPRPAGVS